jgi:hypothetical protein
MNARIRQLTTASAAMAILLGSASCGNLVRQGRSPSLLVIDSLTGASGADPGKFGGTLASDVVTLVSKTVNGQQVRVPTIYDDLGQVQLHIQLKDPGTTGTPSTPSAFNSVKIERYHVSYRRSDGRNTQGVDVPYAFDGAFTATITGSPVQVGFTLVRIQAKSEAPLQALDGGGGRFAISTIADVTFYGHDLAGNDVQETGSISIDFADWGDPS